MVSSGVDSNKNVYPILVDSSGRVYVNLNDPSPVKFDDTIAAHPYGIPVFGKNQTDAKWDELPIAYYTDPVGNKGRYVVPVTPMSSERLEGTKITDGTNTVYVWGSGALTMVRGIHYRIKFSKEWLASHPFLAVANNATAILHIKTDATKSPQGYITVEADGKCYIDVYENPTTTADGTALTEFCMNRETVVNPTAALYHTPTITANGTLIESGLLGQAGHFSAGGGDVTSGYWKLKPSEQYLIIVTNKSGAAADIVIQYGWHEETAV